jgi:hypothetical protein
MEDTDSKWLRVVVYDTLMGHLDAVRILHSTWPSNTPNRWRHILTMAFRLAMAGCGCDLKRDAHVMNEDRQCLESLNIEN